MTGPEDGAWTVARDRRRRGKPLKTRPPACRFVAARTANDRDDVLEVLDASDAHAAAQVERHVSAIRRARSSLTASAFFKRLLSQLEQTLWPGASISLLSAATEYYVLGLGSLESASAQHICHQFALAVELASRLPGLVSSPKAADPAFSPVDRAVCARLGLTVVAPDQAARYGANIPKGARCFYFLPHCGVEVTEGVLQAHRQDLGRVAILGNAFGASAERWSCSEEGRHLRRTANSASKAQRDRCEHPLKADGRVQNPVLFLELVAQQRVLESDVSELSYPVVSAFNDMGLHCFANP